MRGVSPYFPPPNEAAACPQRSQVNALLATEDKCKRVAQRVPTPGDKHERVGFCYSGLLALASGCDNIFSVSRHAFQAPP